MRKPASDVLKGGEVHSLGDGMIKFLRGTRGHAPEQFFELVPKQFNGVEVRRIRGKEENVGAGGANPVQDACGLVRAHIVHHDDIARVEPGHEHGLDKRLEDIGRGGSFNGHQRPDAVQGHGAQHGGDDTPVSGDMFHHSHPWRGSCVSARHADVAAGFVEEDEPMGVKQQNQQEEDTSQELDPRGALLRGYE